MQQIARGIYAIPGLKMGRSYLVEGHDGFALVDTSSPSALDGILAGIAAIGRRPEELRAIIATHYHFDHVGNAGALIERTGAELCVHEADVPYVDGRTPWPDGGALGKALKLAPERFTLNVGRTLCEGDVLPFGGGIEVIHAPGHTPGHIALYSKEHRTLFSGDSFMHLLGFELPMPNATHDMAQARASIRRLATLDFENALPGHGTPILSRANEKLATWAKAWV
jgi:glyoxylase-like metal-dependent hydrolase (beta-lactamase superfamily II)